MIMNVISLVHYLNHQHVFTSQTNSLMHPNASWNKAVWIIARVLSTNHYSVQQLIFNSLFTCRPRKISTEEFGKSWGSLSYEKKVKLTTSSSVKQPAQFMTIMETEFNFHPVQVIGKREGTRSVNSLNTV